MNRKNRKDQFGLYPGWTSEGKRYYKVALKNQIAIARMAMDASPPPIRKLMEDMELVALWLLEFHTTGMILGSIPTYGGMAALYELGEEIIAEMVELEDAYSAAVDDYDDEDEVEAYYVA